MDQSIFFAFLISVNFYSALSASESAINNERCSLNDHFTEGKHYIDPSNICIINHQLFLHLNEEFIPLTSITSDRHGIFIAYDPWHDDDWKCVICGRQSPRYDTKCVSCGFAKDNNSRRWGR